MKKRKKSLLEQYIENQSRVIGPVMDRFYEANKSSMELLGKLMKNLSR